MSVSETQQNRLTYPHVEPPRKGCLTKNLRYSSSHLWPNLHVNEKWMAAKLDGDVRGYLLGFASAQP
ncbi:hypothetical protein OIH33_12525, partial [Lactococcus petauri]|nr:hypothetical protein [Lactococcus petauri]